MSTMLIESRAHYENNFIGFCFRLGFVQPRDTFKRSYKTGNNIRKNGY